MPPTNHRAIGDTVETRRLFLRRLGLGGGAFGLFSLADVLSSPDACGKETGAQRPHFAPSAKRVIFLHQSGAPSQVDLFDDKPALRKFHGQELPDSVRQGQRLTTMTADQKSLPLMASEFAMQRHGECGAPVSELLPYTAKIVDDLCFVRSMHTEAINHDPAITFLQTGREHPGRPSIGAWVSYGIGSENASLPPFAVMISGAAPGEQPLYDRLWGAGFLSAQYQGVKFRSGRDVVLYLSNPPGVDEDSRQRIVAGIRRLNAIEFRRTGHPDILSRSHQFDVAVRMQRVMPELANLADESQETRDLYGPEVSIPGSYASHCLLARRLVESGVRFVQLYHRGWDHHKNLRSRLKLKCRQTDQPSAALITDLKRRGLLDDTLVIWAGEFGRTAYCQGTINDSDYGRDHHPRCFTIWLAGGGVKPGFSHGETDDFSYNIVKSPVHIFDLQATLLHCLGIDHNRLTYRYQGRDHKLTDIGGHVVREILA